MKVVNPGFVPSFISDIKLSGFPLKSNQQKLIAAIAISALAFFALLFMVRKYCCLKSKIEVKEKNARERQEIQLTDEILDESNLDGMPSDDIADGTPEEYSEINQRFRTPVKPQNSDEKEEHFIETENKPSVIERIESDIKEQNIISDQLADEILDPNQDLQPVKTAPPGFKVSDNQFGDARFNTTQKRFENLTKEISTGRLFSSLTDDERSGLSINELTALRCIDHGNRLPLRQHEEPSGVDPSEWDE